jgi:hypothetical protein
MFFMYLPAPVYDRGVQQADYEVDHVAAQEY